jgi:nucleoside-diphosphate kinase
MMERALVVIKPDGIEKSVIGKVIGTFESHGLKVVAVKMAKATSALVGRHYAEDENWLMSVGRNAKAADAKRGIVTKETERQIGMRIRSYLMRELVRSPVVAIVLEGKDANKRARKIAGSTEPRSADPSTIRGMYSTDSYKLADREKRAIRNIVHVSDSPKSANREIKVWFKNSEIFNYRTL